MFLQGYTPQQYDVFEPQFDDGFVTAIGLSVVNGIERAVNMTALYKNQAQAFMSGRLAEGMKRNFGDAAEEEIKLFEQERDEYNANVSKRKENQIRLEDIGVQIADFHSLGTIPRLATQFTSSIIEGLNPVELAADVLAGNVAGKVVKGLSKTSTFAKALSKTSTKMLAETGVESIIGGSYDGIRNMYVYDQWTSDVFWDGVQNRTLFSVGLYGLGRVVKYRGKIRTKEELAEFRKVISQEGVSSSKKVNKRVRRFLKDISDLKANAGKSNAEAVLDSLDRIIDTHFALGSKISKDDILEMIKLPKHSEAWETASSVLSSSKNRAKVNELMINRGLKSEIMGEVEEIINSIPNYDKRVSELGEKRLRVAELQSKGKLKRKDRNELKKLRKEISDAEEILQVKKIDELSSQIKKLDDEVIPLRDDLNSQLTDYDIDTFIREKNQYNEEYLTLDNDKIIEKLSNDVEHSSFRAAEEVVADPKVRSEEVENVVKSGKATSPDEKLNLDIEELQEINKDWETNINEKTNLMRQWVTQGCEL